MLFDELEKINRRPQPFEFYSASDLWTDEYVARQMLAYHLNEELDLASRNIKFINRSVEWITAFFNLKPGYKIADFGCGPGLYTTRLARRQAEVTGVDFSVNSLSYARATAEQEQLSIHYVLQNYLDFRTPERFDLIIMIYCDFCVLSPPQRATLLSHFRDFLNPNGRILLDVLSLKAFEKRRETIVHSLEPGGGFWAPDRYFSFCHSFKYEPEKVLLDKYTIVEANRTRTIYNWLQCFSPESLERELAAGGLAIEHLFADVAGTPFDPAGDEFAVVIRPAGR